MKFYSADRYPITEAVLRWLEQVLTERFNHQWYLTHTINGLVLRLNGCSGSILFDTPQSSFTETCFDHPLSYWDAASDGWVAVLGLPLPVLGAASLPAQMIEPIAQGHAIHYDILGMTYWMLTRLEEVNPPASVLDNHGRFPATASHAYKNGYLERPVVDEWLHILGQIIERTWPGIELKQHSFSMKVSHDVDRPSRYGFSRMPALARAIAGDLIMRRDFSNAMLAPWINMNTRTQLHRADPFNTFDWIMDISEQHCLQSAFYFICGHTDPHDADYQPEHPTIRNLMRRIHQRGHEIGLHPSYGTYQKPQLIRQEADRLRKIGAEEGIAQTEWGGRMHYLRWEQPTTLRAWADAGMAYDSTLSYADRPGFRCGTCFEYPAFDPVAQEALSLRVRPLIAMECTVMAPQYMGLGPGDAALAKFMALKNSCRAVGGCFTLLWHNTNVMLIPDRTIYTSIFRD
jgi:hypothetical protein